MRLQFVHVHFHILNCTFNKTVKIVSQKKLKKIQIMKGPLKVDNPVTSKVDRYKL